MNRRFFLTIMFAVCLTWICKVDAKANEVEIPQDIRTSCEYWGAEYGICPELLMSIAYQETRFRPSLQNGNCKGLCQINIYVYKDNIKRLGITDIYDADQNIHLCADILFNLFSENDDMYYVLNCYNAGTKGKQLYQQGIYIRYAREVSERSAQYERADGK